MTFVLLLPIVVGILRFEDERFNQKSGIYYENVGQIKIITNKWDLTAYLNLTYYQQQSALVKTSIDNFKKHCITITKFNISSPCFNFLNMINDTYSKTLFKEKLILSTIGYKNRNKRELNFKSVFRTAQLLFGMCDIDCIKKFDININNLENSGDKEIKILKEQVKIIKIQQASIMSQQNEILSVEEQLMTSQRGIDFMMGHVSDLNLKLTDYIFEINTVIEIIQSAKIGQIHPSLISTQAFHDQFKDIKVSLPKGTDLPVELDIDNIYELLRLSDLIVYYSNNNNLVFIIGIPLVYLNDLTMYHLIPKPICNDFSQCMYIKPNYNYLAVRQSKELYSTYDFFDSNFCKLSTNFLLCPGIHPLHLRSLRPICEVLLLQEPEEVPENCEIMQLQMTTTIFHKLRYKNQWLYTTNHETIFITCDDDKQSSSHILRVGILKLNETCKGYATRDVLIPGKIDNRAYYIDFIPKSVITENYVTTNFQQPTKSHMKTNQLHDFHDIAFSKNQILNKEVRFEDINDLKENRAYILICYIS